MRLLIIVLSIILVCGCAVQKKTGKASIAVPAIANSLSAFDKENAIIAIENLKEDQTRWNCHDAMLFLYLRREKLMPVLVENLDIDDPQAKQALIRILCETDSFKPDDAFIRLVLDQLENPFTLDLQCHHSIKYDFIGYLSARSPQFHNTITSYLSRKNIFVLYAVTHSLNVGRMLNQHLQDYTPEVMSNIISNLVETNMPYGKSYAVRICFMLGDACIPYLRKVVSDDIKHSLPELVLRAIVDPRQKWLDKIREHGCILESYYLKKAPDYPYGFVPLSKVLISHKPRFLGNRMDFLPPL